QASQEAKKRKAAMEASADGRIIRPRPETDGELVPIVTFLADVLAADQSEEPTMRNASGALVLVEVKQPWSLHTLTADSANMTSEDAEAMTAPAEPVLVELTPTGVELLLENYVRWIVHTHEGTYFGALPSAHVKALMEYSKSALPVVRAINTAPLVTPSGRVIDGVGLDRAAGLVHRIDPVLRACLPDGEPTAEEIKQSLDFLLDEWLRDVGLGAGEKCVAILLALIV